MVRTEPDAPVYQCVQPDGSTVTLDLSAPAGHSDFAVELRLDDGERRRASVYHTGEAGLFLEILKCWVNAATPTEIVSGLEWVGRELEDITGNCSPTVKSENSFDRLLPKIAAIAAAEHAAEPSQHHAEGPSFITLTPDPGGLTLTAEGSDVSPVSCRIASADIPAIVAGMVWRSHAVRIMPLSRLNTATYRDALDTFGDAVAVRVGK